MAGWTTEATGVSQIAVAGLTNIGSAAPVPARHDHVSHQTTLLAGH